MDEDQIAERLNTILEMGLSIMAQMPFDERAFRSVTAVSKRRCRLPEEHPDWEPGWCVDFADGTYATLDGFESFHFFFMTPVFSDGEVFFV